MKNLFLMMTAALLLLSNGCSKYDDSVLTGRVDNLENRVAALEALCKQLNANIVSLQTIVSAAESGDYITSVTPIMQGDREVGYTITFAKSPAITIYHGQDGAAGEKGESGQDGYTPQIGVRQDTDGVWYWILDGNWLLDDDGNPIRAVGRDGEKGDTGAAGKDGITPKLKIQDGMWYVSYDNEQTWQQLGKATGDKGADGQNGTDGQDGDSFFRSVDAASSTEYVIFTLADGTEIRLPRYSQLAIELEQEGTIEIAANATVKIGYTITGNLTEAVTVEVLASGDVKAKVEKTTATTGHVVITAGDSIDEEYTRVVVLVSEGGKTIVKNIVIEEVPLLFPDPIFNAYVLENFDKNNNGKISKAEAAAVTNVKVNNINKPDNEKIKSLQGIEYFTNLTDLDCSYNLLTELNLRLNPKLRQLCISGNESLREFDVSHNPALEDLSCGFVQLQSLDISNNLVLKKLNMTNNPSFGRAGVTLDLSQNSLLEYLSCANLGITDLDVSHNPALTYLHCGSNDLTKLDVSQNPLLETLYCDYTPSLETLDVSILPALKFLHCEYNSLTELILDQNPALEELYCRGNKLTTLDVSKTNLGNSTKMLPLLCHMWTLETLTLKQGWQIESIYPQRDDTRIHPNTKIQFTE